MNTPISQQIPREVTQAYQASIEQGITTQQQPQTTQAQQEPVTIKDYISRQMESKQADQDTELTFLITQTNAEGQTNLQEVKGNLSGLGTLLNENSLNINDLAKNTQLMKTLQDAVGTNQKPALQQAVVQLFPQIAIANTERLNNIAKANIDGVSTIGKSNDITSNQLTPSQRDIHKASTNETPPPPPPPVGASQVNAYMQTSNTAKLMVALKLLYSLQMEVDQSMQKAYLQQMQNQMDLAKANANLMKKMGEHEADRLVVQGTMQMISGVAGIASGCYSAGRAASLRNSSPKNLELNTMKFKAEQSMISGATQVAEGGGKLVEADIVRAGAELQESKAMLQAISQRQNQMMQSMSEDERKIQVQMDKILQQMEAVAKQDVQQTQSIFGR
jgi:hypothetical protein